MNNRAGKNRTILTGVLAALLLLLADTYSRAEQAAPEILFPRDRTRTGRTVNVILAPGREPLTGIFFQVTVNERKGPLVNAASLHVVPGGVLLDPGENRIRAVFFRQSALSGRMKEYASRTLTVYSDNHGRSGAAAAGDIQGSLFHESNLLAGCRSCHDGGDAVSDQGMEKGCISCHSAVASRQIVHGPVAAGACTACHGKDSLGLVLVPAAYSVNGPLRGQKALCGKCHRETTARRSTHGPVAAGMCTVCHDPHSSEHPGRLTMPVNALCRGCHARGELSTCSVRMNGGPGEPVVCTVCHDPHGSENHNLLVVRATIP